MNRPMTADEVGPRVWKNTDAPYQRALDAAARVKMRFGVPITDEIPVVEILDLLLDRIEALEKDR